MLPKNWWSLLEISKKGIDLKSDDLAQKIYFHNLVEQRGGTFPMPFFWKNEFFENQTSEKGSFFLVSEYGNLIDIKTNRDRLGISGESILEQRVQILVLERVENLIEASDAV